MAKIMKYLLIFIVLFFSSASFALPLGYSTNGSSYIYSSGAEVCKAMVTSSTPYAGASVSDFNRSENLAASSIGSGQVKCYYGKSLVCSDCFNLFAYYAKVCNGVAASAQQVAADSCSSSSSSAASSAPGCAPLKGTVANSGLYSCGGSAEACYQSFPLFACNNNCAATFGGTASGSTGSVPAKYGMQNGQRVFYAYGAYWYNGETCTGGAGVGNPMAAVPPDTCAAGQTLTSINGSPRCVGSASSSASGSASSADSSAASSGSATSSAATSGAATSGAATSSGTVPGTVIGGSGSSATSTSASGAATSKTGQAELCSTNPKADDCQSAAKYTNISDVDLKTEKAGVANLTPIFVSSASGCPSGGSLNVLGESVNIFLPACDFVVALRPLILALAWLSAAYIVFGAKT
ncbi:virulence factor TspB C-terminal domain-related protein [Uliginosibacterium aquaticum]|uniref:Uncharacterized protein n=1 Tax=Uliginosibacterium aquaticum TaxID=2731212 RepID=A0ABX2IE72_9RHOO|nr:virulence factor TspB C-terminal domain-related protein [Uliginosibacterium aquaticum]NSL54914.1 hypothetical protein [Uliginosibacterium aquaticum]